MWSNILLFSALAATAGVYWSQSKEGIIVRTKCGSVKGIISKSRGGREFYEWRGIPYGRPPKGSLRFADPLAHGKWEGVWDGSQFGSKCAQAGVFTLLIGGDEDCLFLNINRPAIPLVDGKLLPVMFFIYGGGFQEGSGDMYKPDYFMDEDVILVTINYRVGPFGFITTGDAVISGNMGLKDQVLALKWVQENIVNFGGNPQLVTVFGESAGSSSVEYLLVSPRTKGLFAQAIAQSGSSYAPWAYDRPEVAINYTKKLASHFNCSLESSLELKECLERQSVSDILTVYSRIESSKSCYFLNDGRGHWFRPTLEAVGNPGAFLTEHPLSVLSRGGQHHVRYMIGSNRDDGIFPALPFYRNPEAMSLYEEVTMESQAHQCLGIPQDFTTTELKDRVRDFYLSNISALSWQKKATLFTQTFTDVMFNIYVSHTSALLRRHAPVFAYFFNRTGGPSLVPLVDACLHQKYHFVLDVLFYLISDFVHRNLLRIQPIDYGIGHGDDMIYQFSIPSWLSHVPKDESSSDYNFSRDLVHLWAQFAKNESESLEFRGVRWWPQDNVSDRGRFTLLELSETPGIIEEPYTERVDFWKQFNILSPTARF